MHPSCSQRLCVARTMPSSLCSLQKRPRRSVGRLKERRERHPSRSQRLLLKHPLEPVLLAEAAVALRGQVCEGAVAVHVHSPSALVLAGSIAEKHNAQFCHGSTPGRI